MRSMQQRYIRTSVETYVQSAIPSTKVILDSDVGSEEEWVKITFGDSDPGIVSELTVSLYCNTKKDDEYLKLASLVDSVTEMVREDEGIPYEEPIADAVEGGPYWKRIATMRITSVTQSRDLTGEDETKTRVIVFNIVVINA